MSSPASPVFDLSPPRRPSTDDVGGCNKQQDVAHPPDPSTQLTANDVNQWAALIVALGRVAPLAIVNVSVSGTTASVGQVVSLATAVTSATFSVSRARAGTYTVSWPAGTFPAAVSTPVAFGTSGTSTLMNAMANFNASANAADVYVYATLTGAATDGNFVLFLY